MRARRKFVPALFGFLLFVAAIAAIVELRKHAPPEPARLLPGADAFLYVNLKWMRRADISGHIPPVPHDPEYEQFIQATGFQFERDLDQAAFAIHYGSAGSGGETRFSEVFVAHLDGDKLRTYLQKLATSIASYHSIQIYNIPLENRTLRVAILGVDTVAASNHDDPGVICGIVDRSRKLASPFGGPSMLRQFYRHVPQLPLPSLGWAVFKVSPDAARATPSFAFPGPATVVASVRYLGAVHFRAEAFTENEQSAEQLATEANRFLAIFQSAEQAVAGHTLDEDFKRAMDSIKVEPKEKRTVLTATVPAELIRKLIADAPQISVGNTARP
ncbi:MAG: hypothetical protein JO356_06775 [Acidobacteria bacterium]|nr:hypothetical protein [Acidobacteriota bacterium]